MLVRCKIKIYKLEINTTSHFFKSKTLFYFWLKTFWISSDYQNKLLNLDWKDHIHSTCETIYKKGLLGRSRKVGEYPSLLTFAYRLHGYVGTAHGGLKLEFWDVGSESHKSWNSTVYFVVWLYNHNF